LAVVALAMWHSTSLAPNADFNFFSWARVYQTIGLPFLFIPITSASYVGLPPGKTSEASSLINVARNLGGSIGISLAGAALANSSQVHQNYLTAHLIPASPAYQQALQAATAQLSTTLPQPEAQKKAFLVVEHRFDCGCAGPGCLSTTEAAAQGHGIALNSSDGAKAAYV
jgi:DHA2 family multidrug resistance protein